MAPPPDEPKPYTKYRVRRGTGRGSDAGGVPVAPKAPGATPPPAPPGEKPYVVAGRPRGAGGPGRRPGLPRVPGRLARRITAGFVLKRVAQLAVAWVAVSVVLFLVSATLNQDDVGDGLGGGGVSPFAATNILVLGSDKRPKGSKEPGAGGDVARADSILLMRVGGGKAARLSIPRDTAVDIPGRGRAKINAAYAFGGAALMARTVEDYLGVEVNHVVEVSFSNFPELIDAMGGVDYTGGCVVSKINGGFANGGYTLRLKAGKTRIDGKQALALARTRKNACNPRESDITRARRQQKLFGAMKSRLLSPGAFVRLPFISWKAPRALSSDMAGPTLLGVFAGVATSGTPAARVLRPTGGEVLGDGGQALVVSPAEKQRAVRRFLAG